MRVLISSLIVLAVVPATGNAQAALARSVPVSVAQSGPATRMQTTSGPTIESAAVGIRPAATSAVDASTEAQRRARSGVSQSVTLMIVGGAAMVAGAIIGDDAGTIFLVGGAVIALYGLYQYLR